METKIGGHADEQETSQMLAMPDQLQRKKEKKVIKIRNFQDGDEQRMKEIAPRAFSRFARYGIDKKLPKEKTDEYYREEVLEYAKKVSKDSSRLFILVAYEKTVLGYIVLSIDDKLTRIYSLKWGRIISLAVDPDYHSRGIGSLLIREGLNLLKKKGVKYVEVNTDQNNVAAIRAYEKNGFRVIYSGITLYQHL